MLGFEKFPSAPSKPFVLGDQCGSKLRDIRPKLVPALFLVRRLLSVGGILAVVSMLVTLPRPSSAMHDPQAVVRLVGSEGIATLAPSVPSFQRIAKLRELFDDYFDGADLADFALGRYRASPSPQQRYEYYRLYREYTVQSYAAKLGQVGTAPFHIIGSRSFGREALVSSEFLRPGGSIKIDWKLSMNRRGNYKIIDLAIEGISMKGAQRDEFGQWIQVNGNRFDALLAVMRQQIRREP
jgi:phospholipid transport system substrate-binding protein